MSTWIVTSRNSPILRIGMRSMAMPLRLSARRRRGRASTLQPAPLQRRRRRRRPASPWSMTSPRSTPRWTMVCAICGRMPLMMQSAPISRAAATVLSRCCATSVSTVGTPVMSMMAISDAGLDDPLQQGLHHDLRARAVERADQRQREDAVPELDHRRRQLEHLLLLARDDLLAALLVRPRSCRARACRAAAVAVQSLVGQRAGVAFELAGAAARTAAA